jgi:hypothetical protein
MSKPVHITAVLGSVTPPGRLRGALSEAVDRAAGTRSARPARIELIDLAEQRIAFADGRAPEELDALAQALRGTPPLGPAPMAARF